MGKGGSFTRESSRIWQGLFPSNDLIHGRKASIDFHLSQNLIHAGPIPTPMRGPAKIHGSLGFDKCDGMAAAAEAGYGTRSRREPVEDSKITYRGRVGESGVRLYDVISIEFL